MNVELPDSTEEISIGGESRLIHYTMFSFTDDLQAYAEDLATLLSDSDTFHIDNGIVSLESDPEFKSSPPLSNILWELSAISEHDYSEYLGPEEYFSVEYDMIPVQEDAWEYVDYDGESPQVVDVVAAYVCMLHGSKADDVFSPEGEEDGLNGFFSEERFARDAKIGLLLAIRDAYSPDAPKSPYVPAFLSDREEAIIEASENAVDVTLSETELHALLLCRRNKSNCLRAASNIGKEKIVEDSVEALEGLTKNLSESE